MTTPTPDGKPVLDAAERAAALIVDYWGLLGTGERETRIADIAKTFRDELAKDAGGEVSLGDLAKRAADAVFEYREAIESMTAQPTDAARVQECLDELQTAAFQIYQQHSDFDSSIPNMRPAFSLILSRHFPTDTEAVRELVGLCRQFLKDLDTTHRRDAAFLLADAEEKLTAALEPFKETK